VVNQQNSPAIRPAIKAERSLCDLPEIANIVMAANLDDLEEEVALTRASTIATKSRASYLNSTVRMLTWMMRNKAFLVPDAFRSTLHFEAGGDPTKAGILAALSSAPNNPPLDLGVVEATHFLAWILSMKNKDGGYHSFSTYAGHRSALYNLFRDYHFTMSPQLERELSCHFKGLQHRIASAISSEDGPIKVGNDPMAFSLYRSTAMEMMRSSSREMIFARAFLVISWNLMSRAANTVSLCYNHMEWGEDALKVYFAHMKNDQRGTRPRDPRHIYANPLMPEVCPILALGAYA